jgi:hypothetical protein
MNKIKINKNRNPLQVNVPTFPSLPPVVDFYIGETMNNQDTKRECKTEKGNVKGIKGNVNDQKGNVKREKGRQLLFYCSTITLLSLSHYSCEKLKNNSFMDRRNNNE